MAVSNDQLVVWVQRIEGARASGDWEPEASHALVELLRWLTPSAKRLLRRIEPTAFDALTNDESGNDLDASPLFLILHEFFSRGFLASFLTQRARCASEGRQPPSLYVYLFTDPSTLKTYLRSSVTKGKFGEYAGSLKTSVETMKKSLKRFRDTRRLWPYVRADLVGNVERASEMGSDDDLRLRHLASRPAPADVERWVAVDGDKPEPGPYSSHRAITLEYARQFHEFRIGTHHKDAERLLPRAVQKSGAPDIGGARLTDWKLIEWIFRSALEEPFPLQNKTFLGVKRALVPRPDALDPALAEWHVVDGPVGPVDPDDAETEDDNAPWGADARFDDPDETSGDPHD